MSERKSIRKKQEEVGKAYLGRLMVDRSMYGGTLLRYLHVWNSINERRKVDNRKGGTSAPRQPTYFISSRRNYTNDTIKFFVSFSMTKVLGKKNLPVYLPNWLTLSLNVIFEFGHNLIFLNNIFFDQPCAQNVSKYLCSSSVISIKQSWMIMMMRVVFSLLKGDFQQIIRNWNDVVSDLTKRIWHKSSWGKSFDSRERERERNIERVCERGKNTLSFLCPM